MGSRGRTAAEGAENAKLTETAGRAERTAVAADDAAANTGEGMARAAEHEAGDAAAAGRNVSNGTVKAAEGDG